MGDESDLNLLLNRYLSDLEQGRTIDLEQYRALLEEFDPQVTLVVPPVTERISSTSPTWA